MDLKQYFLNVCFYGLEETLVRGELGTERGTGYCSIDIERSRTDRTGDMDPLQCCTDMERSTVA